MKKQGITLIELLVVISLAGLLFALGIHPILSQLQLLGEQGSEVALFDDANLTVAHITNDAMRAEWSEVEIVGGLDELVFFINATAIDRTNNADPTDRTMRRVVYSLDDNNASILRRVETDLDETQTFSDIIITNKLHPEIPPDFDAAINPPPPFNCVTCTISFLDPETGVTTERSFDIKLRCRDALRDQPPTDAWS